MPSINDAEVKKHTSFEFVKYIFDNLNIEIKKEKFVDFLYKSYKELSLLNVKKEKNIIFDNTDSFLDSISQVVFYGNLQERYGFESFYYKTKNIDIVDERFWFIFDQTIMKNFYFYFYLEPSSFLKEKYTINEIVVYMAKYYDDDEKIYEEKFNQTLKRCELFIDNFS